MMYANYLYVTLRGNQVLQLHELHDCLTYQVLLKINGVMVIIGIIGIIVKDSRILQHKRLCKEIDKSSYNTMTFYYQQFSNICDVTFDPVTYRSLPPSPLQRKLRLIFTLKQLSHLLHRVFSLPYLTFLHCYWKDLFYTQAWPKFIQKKIKCPKKRLIHPLKQI